MGKARRKGPSVVKKVSIHGETHRMIRVTKKRGVRRKPVRGYQLQTYGRKGIGKKKGWMNVVGSFRGTLSEMTKYIKRSREARHY